MRGKEYLWPITKEYGSTFINGYKEILSHKKVVKYLEDIKSISICDVLYYREYKLDFNDLEPLLFFQFKVEDEISQKKLLAFIKNCKTNKYYKDDYWDLGGHILVMYIPPQYISSFREYCKGEYSKMYNPAQIKLLNIVPVEIIKGTTYSYKYACVLTHHEEYGLGHYIKTINQEFKLNYSKTDFIDYKGEYDLPILFRDEILHYDLITPEELIQIKQNVNGRTS